MSLPPLMTFGIGDRERLPAVGADGTYVLGGVLYGPNYGPRGPTKFLITVWNQAPSGYCYETDNLSENLYAKWASRGANTIKQQHPDFVLANGAQAVIDAVKAENLMMIAAPTWSAEQFGPRAGGPDYAALDFRNLAVNDPYWRTHWIGYTMVDEPELLPFTFAEHVALFEQHTLGVTTKPGFWNFTRFMTQGFAPDGTSDDVKWKTYFEYSGNKNNSNDVYTWHISKSLNNGPSPVREQTEYHTSTWHNYGPYDSTIDISLRNLNWGIAGRRFTTSLPAMCVHLHYNGPISPPRASMSDTVFDPIPLAYAPGEKAAGHYVATGRIGPVAAFYPKAGDWQPARFFRDDAWSGVCHGSSNLLVFPQALGSAVIEGYVDAATNRLIVTTPIEKPSPDHLAEIRGAMVVIREAGPYLQVGWIPKDGYYVSGGTPGRAGTYALDPAKIPSVDIGSAGSPVRLFVVCAAGAAADDTDAANAAELRAFADNVARMQAHPTGGNLLIDTSLGGRRQFTALRCPDVNDDTSLYKEDMTLAPIEPGYTLGGSPIIDDGGYPPLWQFGWPMGFEGFHVTGDDGAVYIYIKSMSNSDRPTYFPGYAPLGLAARFYAPFELAGFRRVGSGAAVEMTGTSAVIKSAVDQGAATWFWIDTTSIAQNEGNSGTTTFNIVVKRGGDVSGTQTVTATVSGFGLHPAQASDFSGGVFPTEVLSFGPTETSKTFAVVVNGDTTGEQNETFLTTLSAPSGGAVLAGSNKSQLTCTITNDDASVPSAFVWLVKDLTAAPALAGSPAGAVHLQMAEQTNVTRSGITMRAVGFGDPYDNTLFAGLPGWHLNSTAKGVYLEVPAGNWEVAALVASASFGSGVSGSLEFVDDPTGAATVRYSGALSRTGKVLVDTDNTEYTNALSAVADAVNNLTFAPVTVADLGGGNGRIHIRMNGASGSTHLSAFAIRAGGEWTPANLFAASEGGWWLDPSDLSTMFQDSAGTIPVTAAGQPVGRINDKSGRGNHFIQATNANRPTLQVDGGGRYYLEGDGINDVLRPAAAVAAGSSTKAQIIIGLRTNTLASAMAVATSNDVSAGSASPSAFPGTMGLRLMQFATTTNMFVSGVDRLAASGSAADNTSYVYSLLADLAAPSMVMRKNGADEVSRTDSFGGGTFLNTVPILFSDADAYGYFPGRVYQAMCRFGPNLSVDDRGRVEAFFADKAGVTLP